MNRLENWVSPWNAFIAQARRKPFAWGVHDCCQFARGNVRVLTGTDPAGDWGLRDYATAEEAAALLAELGGIEALPARAGLAEIAPRAAGRGALLLTDFEGRATLGVSLGAQGGFVGGKEMVFVPLAECRRAWRVG